MLVRMWSNQNCKKNVKWKAALEKGLAISQKTKYTATL